MSLIVNSDTCKKEKNFNEINVVESKQLAFYFQNH